MGCGINYYERHLGDYARDTGHLSLLEHGAYNVLLDRYYATEQGIPAGEVYRVARANSAQERKAVDRVLAEFFVLVEGAYRKERVEREIERYREKSGKASASAKARWSKSKGNANAPPNAMRTHMQTHSDGNALQSPDTKHQTPEESSLRSLSGARAEVVSRETLSPDFEDFVMANCPNTAHRKNWPSAFMGARAIVGSGRASEADLRRRWLGFGAFAASGGYSDPSKVPSPQSWFAFQQQGEAYWGKEWGPVPSKAQVAQDANIATSQAWLHQQEARDAAN